MRKLTEGQLDDYIGMVRDYVLMSRAESPWGSKQDLIDLAGKAGSTDFETMEMVLGINVYDSHFIETNLEWFKILTSESTSNL